MLTTTYNNLQQHFRRLHGVRGQMAVLLQVLSVYPPKSPRLMIMVNLFSLLPHVKELVSRKIVTQEKTT